MASDPSNPLAREAEHLPTMSYAGAAHDGPITTDTPHPADDWMKLNPDKESTQHLKKKKSHPQQLHNGTDRSNLNVPKPPSNGIMTLEALKTPNEEDVPGPQLNPADLPLEHRRLEREGSVKHKAVKKPEKKNEGSVSHEKPQVAPKPHRMHHPKHEAPKSDQMNGAPSNTTERIPQSSDHTSNQDRQQSKQHHQQQQHKREQPLEAPKQQHATPKQHQEAPKQQDEASKEQDEPLKQHHQATQATEESSPPEQPAMKEATEWIAQDLPKAKAKESYEEHNKPELETEEEISEGKHLISVPKIADYDAQIAMEERENPGKAMAQVDTRQRSMSELTRGRKPGQGWDNSKIRFAPLNIPLKRRLQTSVVLFHSLSITLGLSIFFLACCLPLLWPLLIVYITYLQFSTASTNGSTNHRVEWLRRSKTFSLFGSYFPARLYRTVELDPAQKYLLGYHPHGIIAHGAFAAFCTESLGLSVLFPGLTFALTTLESNFKIPFYREYALAMGLISVGKRSCMNFLTRGGRDGKGMGKAVVIVVGGASESLDAKEGAMKLTLNGRKGFVKLAIQTGAHLCPVLCFGENELYSTITHDTNPEIYRFQLKFKKMFGWTVPIFHARGVFNYSGGLMPYRHPMHVIVGKPIEVVQEDTPDISYIDELQGKYIAELKRMYYEGREAFAANPKAELQIV